MFGWCIDYFHKDIMLNPFCNYIYEKFYKSTAAVREEVYIGVFHRKILIFAWMFSRINSVILGGINMSEITVIALDAMGGDNAPGEMVKGAVDALGREQDIKVYLLGKEDIVNAELQKYTYDKNRLEVVNTTEVIETAEPPVNAIRRKKDSSIVVGMKMVKEEPIGMNSFAFRVRPSKAPMGMWRSTITIAISKMSV